MSKIFSPAQERLIKVLGRRHMTAGEIAKELWPKQRGLARNAGCILWALHRMNEVTHVGSKWRKS